ncbi:M28 family peptidase [Sphingomonas sp. MMS24-JH45]
MFDKATRNLTEVLPVRPELAAIPLGTMKPVTFPAADGTRIPGYLTLPAGSSGKNLPAIVMPHGGRARDEWGFESAAVPPGRPRLRRASAQLPRIGRIWIGLVPEERLPVVADRGRRRRGRRPLVGEGGHSRAEKLAIVGWSYGGYAALQSSVLAPGLFKAIVAVAPVTDLEMLRGELLNFTNYLQVDRFIGRGSHVRAGSPAQNVDKITAPVMLFHGDRDVNVGVGESRLMARALRGAGKPVDYVEYKGLDHQLDDSMASHRNAGEERRLPAHCIEAVALFPSPCLWQGGGHESPPPRRHHSRVAPSGRRAGFRSDRPSARWRRSSVRRVEGACTRYGGGDEDASLSRQGIHADRCEARQQGQLVPDRADGRDHGKGRAPARLRYAQGAGCRRLWPGHGGRHLHRTGAPRIAIDASPAAFVGYGIVAPEKGWNDYAGLDVKGKTVVILVNDPDYETPGLKGAFNGRAMTYYGRWTYKFEEAARQGAAAAIIVHDTVPAAYGWNVVQSSWTGAQQGADGVADASLSHAIGWITLGKAKALFAAAGQDLAALTAAAKKPGFRAVPLADDDAGVVRQCDPPTRIRNVVAPPPGTTRQDEYVLYTGHWDHLGRCEKAADGDDICNGAVDNATGTAALVALAEANVKAGPTPRSQLFVAWTGEESGLLGSDYYGRNPVVPLRRTVGGVNIDALRFTGPAKNAAVVGGGKSELDACLDRALRRRAGSRPRNRRREKGFYYRSDHSAWRSRACRCSTSRTATIW